MKVPIPAKAHAILGIDPGKTGGICLLDLVANCHEAFSMPRDGDDVDYKHIGGFLHIASSDFCGHIVCILEQQWARPSDAKGAAFRYGEHYGHLQQALIDAGIFYRLVSPMKWTSKLGVGSKADHAGPEMNDSQVHAAWKRHLRDTAALWYPELKPTLKTGDAILLAEYGNLLHQKGDLLCHDKRRTRASGKRRSARPSKSPKATRRRRRKS